MRLKCSTLNDMTNEKLPKWDLESIYPSVTSPLFEDDINAIYQKAEELKSKSADKNSSILSILSLILSSNLVIILKRS